VSVHQSQPAKVILRLLSSLLGILVCVLLIVWSSQIGLSKVFGRYSLLTHSLPAAAESVRWMSSDADAHRALARSFREVQMFREAERELAMAASLRPNDDLIWLELGAIRDQLDDQQGALTAFDQAVARAPYYAHTRWERANLRLRMGRYDEAFAELRDAAVSNRSYLPTLIDLAWALSRGDSKLTEQLAGIESASSRIAYARFLAAKGKGSETLEQYKLAGSSFSEVQKRQLVRSLLTANEYQAAFAIWSGNGSTASQVYDGGFEGNVSFDDVGFGWNVPRQQTNVEVSLDTSEKDSGAKSLRVAYNGNSPPKAPVMSQTIVVKSQQRYRIAFAVKAKDVVSGGLPFVTVTEPQTNSVLATSNLPQNTDSWQKQTIEFTTLPDSKAIVLTLVRNDCSSSPCPVFGVLWFDSFSIEELKQ